MLKSNKNHLFFLGLLILVILVRLPTLFLPIDNDTGATAYHARLILSGEPLYGTHHPAHHLPGIFYTYAAIFALLGDRPSSLQLVLMVWIWINAIYIYKIGIKVSSPFGGILSAIFFVIITSMTNIMGDTAEIELFANLPLTMIIWFGFKIIEQKRDIRSEFLIGILSAVSFLYKPVYFASLLAVILVMLFAKLKLPASYKWSTLAGQYAVIFLGFTATIGLVTGYFAAIGLFNRFLLVFQLGTGYVAFNETPWYYSLLIPLIMILQINIAFVIIGFSSVMRRLIYLPKHKDSLLSTSVIHILLILWLIFSFVSAGFSKFGFFHYVILLIPPFGIIAGTEISDFRDRTKRDSKTNNVCIHKIIAGTFVLLIIGNTLINSWDYFAGFSKFLSNEKTLEEFAIEDTRLGFQNIQAHKIAKYIKENSNSTEIILNWSDQAQVYYLAERVASVDVIWPIYISLLGHPERAIDSQPAFIITGPVLMLDDNAPKWLTTALTKSYHYDISFGEYKIYKRNYLR